MVIYKVRSKTTGLYSQGGIHPTFSKVGKIWKNIGYLRNHFNQLDNHGRNIYKSTDVEIIELVITEEIVCSTSFDDFIQEVADRKQAREDARKARYDKWQQEQRRKQFLELQKEFG